MIRNRLPNTVIVLVFLLSFFQTEPAVAFQSQRDAEAAAEEAVELSELESNGRASSLYRRLHPDAQEIIPKEAVVGWYETDFFPLDPQPIIEITGVEFVTWTWPVTGESYRNTAEVSYVQPFGSGANVTYTEEVVRLVEEDGDWHWFFGRSQEFVDTQIARFPAEQERASSSSTSSRRGNDRESRVTRSSADCTVVQLYPGYPGYRGNITGVMAHWGGQGDYECLELLEEADPGFSKSREDRRNERAANDLGIGGSMEVWTWENWMLIESERGMTPSCYTCLMFDSEEAPLNPEFHSDSGDIRVMTGLPGHTVAIDSILVDLYGHSSVANVHSYFKQDDYVLRALAYMQDWTMNATELYGEMTAWIEIAGGGSTGYAPIDYEAVLQTAVWDLGGYVRVSADTAVLDQEVLMWFSILASTIPLMDDMELVVIDAFSSSLTGWNDEGNRGTLRSYMQDERFWQQFD